MPHERSPHVDIFKHWINMLDGLMLSCARRDIQVERLLSTKVLCIELNYRKSTHPSSKTYTHTHTSCTSRVTSMAQNISSIRSFRLLYAAQPKAQRQWTSWIRTTFAQSKNVAYTFSTFNFYFETFCQGWNEDETKRDEVKVWFFVKNKQHRNIPSYVNLTTQMRM